MKIRPVGAQFHADVQTNMTKLTVAFRNFANAPKSGKAKLRHIATAHTMRITNPVTRPSQRKVIINNLCTAISI